MPVFMSKDEVLRVMDECLRVLGIEDYDEFFSQMRKFADMYPLLASIYFDNKRIDVNAPRALYGEVLKNFLRYTSAYAIVNGREKPLSALINKYSSYSKFFMPEPMDYEWRDIDREHLSEILSTFSALFSSIDACNRTLQNEWFALNNECKVSVYTSEGVFGALMDEFVRLYSATNDESARKKVSRILGGDGAVVQYVKGRIAEGRMKWGIPPFDSHPDIMPAIGSANVILGDNGIGRMSLIAAMLMDKIGRGYNALIVSTSVTPALMLRWLEKFGANSAHEKIKFFHWGSEAGEEIEHFFSRGDLTDFIMKLIY